MRKVRYTLAALGTSALLVAAPLSQAQAQTGVVGHGGSTIGCLDGTTNTADVDFRISARTVEELEGPTAKLTGITASNPCAFTVGIVVGVTTHRGTPLTLAFNVRPGSSVTLTAARLRHYGIGTCFTFTNSYGTTSGPVSTSPGTRLLATF